MTATNSHSRSSIAVKAIAVVVVGGAVYFGATSFAREIEMAFQGGRVSVISPQLTDGVLMVKRIAPSGSTIFYISQTPEYWNSKLWQRALYPDVAVILIQTSVEVDGPRLKQLKEKYSVHYALSVGDPPLDPGFRWHHSLPSLPGVGGQTWFGKLSE